MTVYWSLFFWTLLIFAWYSLSPRLVTVGGLTEQRPNLFHVIIGFAPIIFFAGAKGYDIIDSGAYIWSFNVAQSSLWDMAIDWESRAVGFDILEVAFKHFISSDYSAWLFFLALISCIAVMIPLYKYSPLFGLSLYLFVASAQFAWLLNGVRQFLAVAILFGCMDLVIERKHFKYILIVLLMSTIHFSALLMIPAYFFIVFTSKLKSLIGQIGLPLIIFLIMVIAFEQITPVARFFLEDTAYEDTLTRALFLEGVNIFRLLVAAVPVVLLITNYKRVSKLITPEIHLCIMMSLINFGSLLIASTIGGNPFGRIAIYFGIYNLITLPWLITKCFNKISSQIVTILAILLYAYWFYYQMVVTWDLPYTSDLLGIYLFN